MGPEAEPTAAILAVDDYPANLDALDAVLAPLGLDVVMARSGREALRKAREQDFVLVLMDVHMPELDGYQTVELLRQYDRAREVPIVFLTAVYDQIEHTRRGYALGAVDYITKPFDVDILRAKVRALVALYTRGLRAERARRDERDRIKDLFLGAVGHDLRNPLNAVVVGARALQDKNWDDESRQRWIHRIERSAWSMNRIVEDLLDLTRGQFEGGVPIRPEPSDLGEIVKAAAVELHAAHPGRSIDVQVTGDTRGNWDPGRLSRVASNLVGNALQHSTEDPVRVEVTGGSERVSLAVHNLGTPIPESARRLIFEPFRRGDASAEGLGLGLYIVREIARAHGGTVDVTSTAADGTRFNVDLPKKSVRPTDG